MRYAAIINPDASTLKAADLSALARSIRKQFAEAGHRIAIDFLKGDAIADALKAAARARDIDAVLAGGGDGTISAAAGLLARTGKALAVLPGGNMNFYARSLGIPLHLEKAITALANGRPVNADISYAANRPFIHEFSLGMHPEMIELRDKQTFGSRLGKFVGSIRSLGKVILRPPRVRVGLDDGRGGERRIATAALVVSNNPFGAGHLPYPDRVDGGELGVYVARTLRSTELAAIAARLSDGSWNDMPQIESFTAKKLRLTRRRPMKAAIDGELVTLRGPVDIRIEPGALTVIAPSEEHAVPGQ